MKPHPHLLRSVQPAASARSGFARSLKPLQKEDPIFCLIDPGRTHWDEFSRESSVDWGQRILSEGNLGGALGE